MPFETHFVQAGDGPVLIGAGAGTLACSCGQVLIQGYVQDRFLAVGIRCGRCETVTTTPALPAGEVPPRSAIVAAPSTQPRVTAMTVPAGVAILGQAEMGRLQALFQPASLDHVYAISPVLLNGAEAAFALHAGGSLREAAPDHPLGSAVRHLRVAMQTDPARRWRMRRPPRQ